MHQTTVNARAREEGNYTPVAMPLLGANARFVLLWCAIPILLRVLTVWHITPAQESPPATAATTFARALTAVPQDLCIAAQIFVAMLLLKGVCCWNGRLSRARLFAVVPLTIFFGLTQFYVLFDFLLYWKTSVRLDYSFLDFIPTLGAFRSSAEAYGLAPLFFGAAMLTALTAFAGQYMYSLMPELRLSKSSLLWLALIAALGWASIKYTPAELAYATQNVLLNDQIRWVESQLAGDDLTVDPRDEATLLASLRQGERYQRLSPQYPLLKNTTGFSGEKLFDLRIDPQERPHVIFLQMESFRTANIGALGAKQPASPEFDRLAQEGILFRNFYGNGVQTTRGSIASQFGILPHFAPAEVQAGNPSIPLIGIPDLFHRRGYHNAFIYGSPLDFENTGDFFTRHGFDSVQGIDDLLKAFPKAFKTSWGVHDEYVLKHVADYLEQQDQAGKPTFIYTLTISNHHPWQVPPTFKPPQFDVPPGGEYPEFLKSFAYSDNCLGGFVRLLKQRGLDKKTILVIYADTSTPMGEHDDNFMLINHLYEENVRIPLLILAPGRIEQPAVIDELGSQVDLLPTIMDLFQMTGTNHSLGTSLVRRVPSRAVYFNNPFAMQYVGMRHGDWKYIYTVRAKTPALYNLKEDPGETRNLAAERPDLVRIMHGQSVGLNQWMSRQFWQERFVPREMTTPTPQ